MIGRGLLLTGALSACSGNGAATDAALATDTSLGPPSCPVAEGVTYVMSSIGFKPPGEGYDLDGDSTIDNALGFLAPVANEVLAQNIASGFSRYLFQIQRWSGAPADDPDVTMVSYSGLEALEDTSQDFTGSGEFNVTDREFDVNCTPQNVTSAGAIANRTLHGHANHLGLYVRYVGTVEFTNVTLNLQMSADLASAQGDMGAVMTACGASRAYLPQLGAGTLFDLLLSQNKQPDLDVDGDGLETINYVDNKVASCVDGDGTPITGPECMCDSRIGDGYSFAVFVTGVSCKIDGVLRTE